MTGSSSNILIIAGNKNHTKKQLVIVRINVTVPAANEALSMSL